MGGATLVKDFIPRKSGYFNPRSPWGERLQSSYTQVYAFAFQSTLPVGGATDAIAHGAAQKKNFNPRSPWGERPTAQMADDIAAAFQSTLPVGGAT